MTKTWFIFISKSLDFHPGYSKRLVCQPPGQCKMLTANYCFQGQKRMGLLLSRLICMVKTIVHSLCLTLTGCDTQHFNRITSIQICPFLLRPCQGKIVTSVTALKWRRKTAGGGEQHGWADPATAPKKSPDTLIKSRQGH